MRRRAKSLPKEVFISHAHRDRAFVKRLVQVLQAHQIKYWYSPKHIAGAQEWHDEIGKALVRCDWFMLVLSPQAVKSKWVVHEYFYAFDTDRYTGRIVPVLYKPCRWERLSWTLRRFQWVNFDRDFDAGCFALLKTWGIQLQKGRC